MPSTTLAPTVSITQFESLPVYLALVSIITIKCKKISAHETELKAACDSLSESVAKYRAMLEPLNSILPAVSDLSGLEVKGIDFARLSIVDPDTFQSILQTFQRETRIYDSTLPGDEIHAAYFSKENQEKRAGIIAKGGVTADWGELIELAIVTLGQVRMTRQESIQGGKQTKWLLVVSLLPQILVLTCIILQYMILKKRELAAKRRNHQIARDRQLLDQLMERRREGQQLEMV